MSIEDHREQYPSPRETLKPKAQLEVACANAIDQRGVQRDSEQHRIVHEAEWDDGHDYRFRLRKQEYTQPNGCVEYVLNVYDILSRDTLVESYGYSVLFKKVQKFREEGSTVGKKCDKAIPELLQYLGSSTQLPTEQNKTFLEIMVHDPLHDPRPAAKARRLASEAIRRIRTSMFNS